MYIIIIIIAYLSYEEEMHIYIYIYIYIIHILSFTTKRDKTKYMHVSSNKILIKNF